MGWKMRLYQMMRKSFKSSNVMQNKHETCAPYCPLNF